MAGSRVNIMMNNASTGAHHRKKSSAKRKLGSAREGEEAGGPRKI